MLLIAKVIAEKYGSNKYVKVLKIQLGGSRKQLGKSRNDKEKFRKPRTN